MWSPLRHSPEVWTQYLLPGLINTLKAAAISHRCPAAFGLVFGMGRLSHNSAVRWVCGIVVEFFRSVPVLLMMYFFFQLFALNDYFGTDYYPARRGRPGPDALQRLGHRGARPLRRLRAPEGPAGGRAVDRSAAGQTLRSIQLPQALTAMLPALVGQLVVILKDTALGTIILYPELLTSAKTLGRRMPTPCRPTSSSRSSSSSSTTL